MKTAAEIPWPPPVEVPYRVEDGFGAFVEVVAEGAYDGAEEIEHKQRTFVVAEEEWDDEMTERRILRFAKVSRDG